MCLKKIAAFPAFALTAVLALGFLAEANWTMKGRQGGPDRKMTLKLKTEGDKVTGKLNSPGRDGADRETEIKDGKLKGDEISFSVTREMNGNSMTSKYTGKVAGDTIKGKMEMERNGEPVSRDWEAKRGTDTKDAKEGKDAKETK